MKAITCFLLVISFVCAVSVVILPSPGNEATAQACLVYCPAGDGTSAAPGTYPSPDLNRDARVTLVDFSMFGGLFTGSTPYSPCADYNCDGVIDLVDFTVFASHWTHTGATPGGC